MTMKNPLSMPEPTQVHMPAEKQSASSTAKPSKSPAGTKRVATPSHPVVDKAEWCMVVVAEGEYPTLEIFPDVESLTTRMRALEGGEVNVFPFYGVPVPFTAGPTRFLKLPDGEPYPVFAIAGFGSFLPNPTAALPLDPSYCLASQDVRGEFPKTAVVDHRPTAAEAGGGNVQRAGGGQD